MFIGVVVDARLEGDDLVLAVETACQTYENQSGHPATSILLSQYCVDNPDINETEENDYRRKRLEVFGLALSGYTADHRELMIGEQF